MDDSSPTPYDLDGWLEHFRQRVLQDALNEGTRIYWLRRAEAFSRVGTARAEEIATACRNAAQIAPLHAPQAHEVTWDAAE